MTPEAIANVIAILMQQLTLPQRFEVLGRIVASVLGAGIPTAPAGVPQQQAQQAPEAAPVPTGKVMIHKGFVCECDACHLPVYRIEADVLENMPKKAFVAAFVPMGEAPELKMPLDTWADSSGNLAIDCPLCKGTKSLWIKGKGDIPYNDVPTGSDSGSANPA